MNWLYQYVNQIDHFTDNMDNLNVAIHDMRRKLDIVLANLKNNIVRRNTHIESNNF